MKKITILNLFIFLIFIYTSYAQDYFEGEVEYEITYESLNDNIPVSFFETEIGTSMSAYIKEDRYLIIYKGKGELGWMKTIVRLDEGYTYTEYDKNDTIFKKKFGNEKEVLTEFKRNGEDKKVVLNEVCESITLNYKSIDPEEIIQIIKGKYYFNRKYKLNTSLYKNYTNGFWNLFVEESESISLRNEMELGNFVKIVQEAKFIVSKELPIDIFDPNKEKIVVLE